MGMYSYNWKKAHTMSLWNKYKNSNGKKLSKENYRVASFGFPGTKMIHKIECHIKFYGYLEIYSSPYNLGGYSKMDYNFPVHSSSE